MPVDRDNEVHVPNAVNVGGLCVNTSVASSITPVRGVRRVFEVEPQAPSMRVSESSRRCEPLNMDESP